MHIYNVLIEARRGEGPFAIPRKLSVVAPIDSSRLPLGDLIINRRAKLGWCTFRERQQKETECALSAAFQLRDVPEGDSGTCLIHYRDGELLNEKRTLSITLQKSHEHARNLKYSCLSGSTSSNYEHPWLTYQPNVYCYRLSSLKGLHNHTFLSLCVCVKSSLRGQYFTIIYCHTSNCLIYNLWQTVY